jgi:ADP-heptose:LPS heptosyltransferase
MGMFGTLEPGMWLVTDQNACEIGLHCEREEYEISPFTDWRQSGNVGGVLIVANGAKGDLLFLTPVLRELKTRLEGVNVTLACFPFHHSMFDGVDLFHKLIAYPVSLDEVAEFDRVVSLENVIENAGMTHSTDAFAKKLEVDVITDYQPVYCLTPFERAWAEAGYQKAGRPRVGLQMAASVANRNYPLDHWLQVIKGIIGRGWDVFVFGYPGQYPRLQTSPHLHNLTLDNLDFRQSAAVLSTCDAFCGVDSVWVHMCHALDIPAIGLFGPFPFEARTAKAPKTLAISGHGECAPCFWHIHAGNQFPPNKPCSRVGKCVVLESIEPTRIIAKIDALKSK